MKTKNPENRLKLTIRVKRSPDFPEYEILRTEGINYTESTSETISSVSSKHRKRRRHKKNKSKRKELNYDSNEKNREEKQMSSTKRVKLLFGESEMKMKILNIPNGF